MENKEIVLDELKDLYDDGYIFGDIAHFVDTYRHEKPKTEVGRAYDMLPRNDELEVLEEYLKYRKQRRLLNE